MILQGNGKGSPGAMFRYSTLLEITLTGSPSPELGALGDRRCRLRRVMPNPEGEGMGCSIVRIAGLEHRDVEIGWSVMLLRSLTGPISSQLCIMP